MPLDSSIPLSYRPSTELMSPGQLISMKDLVQRTQIQGMEVQKQNAIHQIMQAPGSVGPGGTLTPQAIMGIAQQDPPMAIRLSEMQQQIDSRNLAMQQKKTSRWNDIEASYVSTYDRLVQSMPPDEALRQAKDSRRTAIEEFQKSGEATQYQFSDKELDYATKHADKPIEQIRALVLSHGGKIDSPPEGQFQKDLRSAGIQPGTPEWSGAMKKRIEKETAPSATSLAGTAVPNKEALYLAVDQYLAGDKTAGQGYARNALAKKAFAERLAERAKEKKMGGADIAAVTGEYEGFKAGQRSLGTRQAQVDLPVQEAQNLVPLALKASSELKRTNIKSVNDLILGAKAKTSSPELRRLAGATNALINVYARAVSPTGAPTMSDKDHAREVLDKGFSDGDYQAAVDQLQQEMKAAQESPGQVRKRMRGEFTGKTEVEKGVSKSGKPMHKNAEGKWEYD